MNPLRGTIICFNSSSEVSHNPYPISFFNLYKLRFVKAVSDLATIRSLLDGQDICNTLGLCIIGRVSDPDPVFLPGSGSGQYQAGSETLIIGLCICV